MASETLKQPVGSINHEILDDNRVLIVGGGPVGLLTAVVLAFYDVPSVIIERNSDTRRWPKMDLTNVRSMELFRKLGLADELRRKGVPSETPYHVLMTTGLTKDRPVTTWDHPSVEEFQRRIRAKNDGTQPLEPYQRISQEVFEAWMKTVCDDHPLIDVRFGWKLESIKEMPDGVAAEVSRTAEPESKPHHFNAKYAVACDGASSRFR